MASFVAVEAHAFEWCGLVVVVAKSFLVVSSTKCEHTLRSSLRLVLLVVVGDCLGDCILQIFGRL